VKEKIKPLAKAFPWYNEQFKFFCGRFRVIGCKVKFTWWKESPKHDFCKKSIIEIAVTGIEIQDTARVGEVSTSTVINEFKKEEKLENVTQKALARINPATVIVEIQLAAIKLQSNERNAEVDEMQNFVVNKTN